VITIEDLKRYEIFAEMDLTELKLLSAMAEERQAREGEELIRAGSPARTLYILQEGGLMITFPDGRAPGGTISLEQTRESSSFVLVMEKKSPARAQGGMSASGSSRQIA